MTTISATSPRQAPDVVTCWTRQVPQVMEEIERTGRYVVREEYVRAKNDTISDYYLGLYRWYTHGCRRLVDIPADADLPIWLALTPSGRLGMVEGTVSLTLAVPRDHLFVLDYDKWGYRVNDWYVPSDEADEQRHNEELARMGVTNESLLFTSEKGNFYPALRRKIEASWQRVFSSANEDMEKNVGTIWEIRKEWVVDVERWHG